MEDENDNHANLDNKIDALEALINGLSDDEEEEVKPPVKQSKKQEEKIMESIKPVKKQKEAGLDLINDLENMIDGISDEESSSQKKPQKNIVVEPPQQQAKKQPQSQKMQEEKQPVQKTTQKMQIEKPQIQEEEKKPVNQRKNLLEMEEFYRNPNDMKSALVLKKEIQFLEQKLNTKLPDQLRTCFQEKLVQLKQSFQLVIENMKNKIISESDYATQLKQIVKTQNKLLKYAFDDNNKMYQGQIQQRLKSIEVEQKCLETRQGKAFQTIVQLIGTMNQAQSQQKQGQVNSISKDLSQYKGKINQVSILVEQIDSKSQIEKLKIHAARHKQYHNLICYYSAQMKDEKKQYLEDFLFPVLQKSKQLKVDLKDGKDVKIGELLVVQMPEITYETFMGYQLPEIRQKAKDYIEKFNQQIKDERNFAKIAGLAKKAPKNDLVQLSKQNVESFEAAIKVFMEIERGKEWIPFPFTQLVSEKRQIQLENKDIELNQMVLQFERFLNLKAGKYYVGYSIPLCGKVQEGKTEFCSDNGTINYETKLITTLDKKQTQSDLHTKEIQINVFEKGFFSNSAHGSAVISLAEFETNHTIKKKIDIKHEKQTFQLEINIQIRQPTGFITNKQMEYLKVIKLYPPFNLNENVDQYVQEDLKTAKFQESSQMNIEQPQQLKQSSQSQPKQQAQQPQQQQQQQGIKSIVLNLRPDDQMKKIIKQIIQTNGLPQNLTEQEILFPDNDVLCQCFSFIEKILPEIESKIEACIKSGDPSLAKEQKLLLQFQSKLQDLMVKLSSEIQQEILSADQYKAILLQIQTKDNLLSQFYQANNIQAYFDFIEFRKALVKEELTQFP